MSRIYKIVTETAWKSAVKANSFTGAAIDLADGYIHLSSESQVEETALKHFAGQTDLLLVAYETGIFGTELKWEVSRGGALFPHLYAALDPSKALWAKPMPWNGVCHDLPRGWRA